MPRRLAEILDGLFGRAGAGDDAGDSADAQARRCPACDSLLYDEEGRRGVVRCLGCDALWRWSAPAGRWERVKR